MAWHKDPPKTQSQGSLKVRSPPSLGTTLSPSIPSWDVLLLSPSWDSCVAPYLGVGAVA